jgi:hypothetical protein
LTDQITKQPVPPQLVPFVPGDPRINRKGRPKTIDAVRKLVQNIAYEEVVNKGESFTTLELIFRDWASSKMFEKQLAFVQYGFGKVPDKLLADNHDVSIIVNWDKVITATEVRREMEEEQADLDLMDE